MKRITLVLVAWLTVGHFSGIGASPRQELLPNEVWFNPGIGLGASTNLSEFMTHIDAALMKTTGPGGRADRAGAPEVRTSVLLDPSTGKVTYSVLGLLEGPDDPIEPTAASEYVERAWRVWTFPGTSPVRSVDIPGFVFETDVVFVGTLADVKPVLIDDREVRTKLVFRAEELLHGTLPAGGEVEVWMRSGVYEENFLERLSLKQAVGSALPMPRGRFFVAAARFVKPGSPFDGQLWLEHPNTLATFVDAHVIAIDDDQTWVERTIRQGRAILPPPGRATDEEAFLGPFRRFGRPSR